MSDEEFAEWSLNQTIALAYDTIDMHVKNITHFVQMSTILKEKAPHYEEQIALEKAAIRQVVVKVVKKRA